MGSIVTECILRGNYKIIILLIRKENLCHIRMIMVMHGYFRIKDHRKHYSSIVDSWMRCNLK